MRTYNVLHGMFLLINYERFFCGSCADNPKQAGVQCAAPVTPYF